MKLCKKKLALATVLVLQQWPVHQAGAQQIAKLDEVDAENNAKIGELQVRPSTTIHQKNKMSTLTSRPCIFSLFHSRLSFLL